MPHQWAIAYCMAIYDQSFLDDSHFYSSVDYRRGSIPVTEEWPNLRGHVGVLKSPEVNNTEG